MKHVLLVVLFVLFLTTAGFIFHTRKIKGYDFYAKAISDVSQTNLTKLPK